MVIFGQTRSSGRDLLVVVLPVAGCRGNIDSLVDALVVMLLVAFIWASVHNMSVRTILNRSRY